MGIAFPLLVLNLVLGLHCVAADDNAHDVGETLPSLNSGQVDSRGVLVFSTLDGVLYGVNAQNGDILWKLQNDPRIKVSATSKTAVFPIFLPDPKDGTLYSLNTAGTPLKKLPFSIQQLVASSPCRSADGIFYMGQKHDNWFTVDVSTGQQKPLLSVDQETCPMKSPDYIFMGRTDYNLIMFDNKSNFRHWNITYSDYTSHDLPKEQMKNYALKHVSSISSGRVKTIDRISGSVLWENDFGSPLVSVYLKSGQDMITVPFTSFAESTLDSAFKKLEQLAPTLYIGEHDHGLYALPSLVDSQVAVVSDVNPRRLMIGGPDEQQTQSVIIGHYHISSVVKSQLLITGRSDPIIQPKNGTNFNSTSTPAIPKLVAQHVMSFESKILAVVVGVLSVFVIGMFYYILVQVREIKQSSGSSGSGGRFEPLVQTQKGIVSVGKISFDTTQILGKGCEGTFVFRGEFDGRQVAVKRLLPESFTVADREVQLLRESDAHPNVIRYFSTEQDPQFRYIALELCSATLQDYVEKRVCGEDIQPVQVLKQSISGLAHLHSLKIVHRDIKPHNILLSASTSGIRVLISDFGLCKKLHNGKVSFSRRSGITGTEGWIAPEMIQSNGRVTSAVDIFSMGCVFYYTLVNGKHPFGEPIRRQSNILSDDYKLTGLENEELWKSLISKMISNIPSERPGAETVQSHPSFWDKALQLTFLQDVSDRVEKEGIGSEVLLSIETGGRTVCRGDWTQHIDAEVSEDLGKYRTYRGDSVRDLLRALRNKKHHYRELSSTAQALLGPSQESYLSYWITRFPLLLFHSWTSLQYLRSEPALSHYYDPHFIFPLSPYTEIPDWVLDSPSKSTCTVLRARKRQKNEPDKEAWIKAGEQNGAWRPGRERRRPKLKNEVESIVWKLT